MWVLAALSMTIGNVVALRQTNLVRMLAYSGISQAGFILAPMAVVGQIGGDALTTVVTYLLIYAAMNLGAFTVVMAVARKTGSAEISTFGGLFNYAPSLAVLMTVFLFSLAGIPPLGGWLAKFVAFRAVVDADTGWAYALAVVMAVNSVIALAYYANVAKEMWMNPAPDGDQAPVRVPVSLTRGPRHHRACSPWRSASPRGRPSWATWPTSSPPWRRSAGLAGRVALTGAVRCRRHRPAVGRRHPPPRPGPWSRCWSGRSTTRRRVLRVGRPGRPAAGRLPDQPRGRALFGAVVARALDAGGGHGLARPLRRGRGRRRARHPVPHRPGRRAGVRPALRYVLVERSAAQRRRRRERLRLEDPALAFAPVDPDTEARSRGADRARSA